MPFRRSILAGLAAALAGALALAACHPADRLADASDAATPGGGAPCGGIADPRCPDGHYCWKSPKAARGADMRGQCRPQPASCPPGHHPVCGADLKTYETPCLAAMNGANVMREGACPAR
jgi:hypothetical protein